ncbi:MAG TPA: ABC transporter permease, partial [Nocardioidaceae bacterium]|nr:ABC transporter permease [Nocardioidaceae bacterium]
MTTTLVTPQEVAEAGSATPSRRRQRSRRAAGRLGWLRRWASPVAILLTWQLLSNAGILTEDVLASPLQILSTGIGLLADGTLQSATATSITRVVSGFLIGASVGLVLATVAGLSRVGEDAVDPPMQMLRTLPHFGLIPLFIVWMGIGETPKIALIAMGVTFPLYLNTFAGIRSVDRKLLEAAHTLNLTHRQRLRHVVIPGALPQALVGLRQSLGVAWLSLIVAETVSADAGLGYLINDAREFLKTDVIVVGLAVYSLLGLLTDTLVRLIERKALT